MLPGLSYWQSYKARPCLADRVIYQRLEIWVFSEPVRIESIQRAADKHAELAYSGAGAVVRPSAVEAVRQLAWIEPYGEREEARRVVESQPSDLRSVVAVLGNGDALAPHSRRPMPRNALLSGQRIALDAEAELLG